MNDFLGKIKSEQSGLEKLVSSIPGYKGYKEKEQRREADRLLRETLARQFEVQWQRIAEVINQMSSPDQLEYLEEIDKASTLLRGFIDKLKTAAMGYSGFFDAVKVKEEALDKLYQFDSALADKVGDLSTTIDAVQAALDSGEALKDPIRKLNMLCRQINVLFEQRKSVLTEM